MAFSLTRLLKEMGLIGMIGVIFLLFLAIGPFLLIWSFNELFNLGIQFNFWTWLAGFLIILILRKS